jgi:hypothetical protein
MAGQVCDPKHTTAYTCDRYEKIIKAIFKVHHNNSYLNKMVPIFNYDKK